jgi:hypothetical protein
MIYATAQTVLEATRQSCFKLLSCQANSDDPSILHESAAVIEVTEPQKEPQGFTINNDRFSYQLNYDQYFPLVDPSLIKTEENDYTKLFIDSGHLYKIISSLKKHPDSRRNIISTWSSTYLDPDVVGVCITQLYFRLYQGKLDMHSHARANDAYRLLLLDMQLAISIQMEVAKAINKSIGKYVHFVDSLHYYRRYEQEIQQQHFYMSKATVWSLGKIQS